MKRPYEYHIYKRKTKKLITQPFHVRIEYRGKSVYCGEKKANKGEIVRIARKENANRIKPYPIIDNTGLEPKEIKAL